MKETNLTPGMLNAYAKVKGSKRECSKCGFELPKYPGAYPKLCPKCGELLFTIAVDQFAGQPPVVEKLLDLLDLEK